MAQLTRYMPPCELPLQLQAVPKATAITKRLRQVAALLLLLVTVSGCFPHCTPMQVDPCYELQECDIRRLTSPFPPLTLEEQSQTWAIEQRIGIAFARSLDFYRAITSFQRALILLPPTHPRQMELHYDIVLCYYLANRYQEAIEAFERSPLVLATADFPAYRDLLLVLYECFRRTCQPQQADFMLQQIAQTDPLEAEALSIHTAVSEVDLPALSTLALSPTAPQQLNDLLIRYCECRKSERKAEVMAAILPGSGYWYIGQKQAAITSALLNGLFIWAAYTFFDHNNIAAGIITTSLELGWYFGGIYGSAEGARYYNERIWECEGSKFLRHHTLFPVLRLSYAF